MSFFSCLYIYTCILNSENKKVRVKDRTLHRGSFPETPEDFLGRVVPMKGLDTHFI